DAVLSAPRVRPTRPRLDSLREAPTHRYALSVPPTESRTLRAERYVLRMTDAPAGISALASENRTFPPSEATKRDALVTGTWMYDEAAEDDQGFWAKQAGELLDWDTEWDTICEWDL